MSVFVGTMLPVVIVFVDVLISSMRMLVRMFMLVFMDMGVRVFMRVDLIPVPVFMDV
jgi:hypothetical protein